MASNDMPAVSTALLRAVFVGAVVAVAVILVKDMIERRTAEHLELEGPTNESHDSGCGSSSDPIIITPPTSGSDPDLARWTLAQSRTTDHIGRVRSGLVLPPVLSGGRFRHENVYLREGGGRSGLRNWNRKVLCPKTPRLVVLDGVEDELEEMEKLRL